LHAENTNLYEVAKGDIVDIGIFNIPYALAYADHRRSVGEVIEWDLQLVRWADAYGLAEAHFAEHYTIGHEPSPAPDLMIAAASQLTTNIKLAAAAHLLPYHNPISLAHRLMWLDHMTGGRYVAGFAPGSFPTDAQLFGIALADPGIMSEALEIIQAIWTHDPPFRLEGKHWTVDMPTYTEQWHGPHLKPLQRPHPEVVITGMQAQSPSFQDAGRRGFAPMSQQVSKHTLCQHWDTYAAAAEEAGRTADRSTWRVIRDIFVADSDEEARRLVLEGEAGRTWSELVLPTFKAIRSRGEKAYALGELLVDPGMELEDLTVEWMVDNFWLVGSPDTVLQKLTNLNDDLGGFGTVITFAFDYSEDPEPYRRNLELLGREVAPRMRKIGPQRGARV
jgi:alkanesulfonate monooxygenase SsuD/methylene tetrahydromethanopterin reductase-like flavin-dependent oxidoreductase (luciferase family)